MGMSDPHASDSARFRKLDALFDAALDVPPSARAEFVERACAADTALRRELLRLLGLVESSGGFLESSAIDIAAPLFGPRARGR